MLWQQLYNFFHQLYDEFFGLWMVMNVVLPVKIWWVRRWLKRKWIWFQHEHLRVPLWMTFVSLAGGLLLPTSPWVLDGMILGALIYFANEACFVTFQVSPLNTLFTWIDVAVVKVTKSLIRVVWVR